MRNIVFQYKADQGDCKNCMGTKKFDKLEVYVRGTETVDWEGRDPGQFDIKIPHKTNFSQNFVFCLFAMDILVKLAKPSKSRATKLDVSHGPILMVSHLVRRNGRRNTISLVNYNPLFRYHMKYVQINSTDAKILNE